MFPSYYLSSNLLFNARFSQKAIALLRNNIKLTFNYSLRGIYCQRKPILSFIFFISGFHSINPVLCKDMFPKWSCKQNKQEKSGRSSDRNTRVPIESDSQTKIQEVFMCIGYARKRHFQPTIKFSSCFPHARLGHVYL